MIYLIILLVLIILIYIFVSQNVRAYVNGIFFTISSVGVFNCILPIIYELYNHVSYYDYKYIFVYYIVNISFLSIGYLIFSKKGVSINFNFGYSMEKAKFLEIIILFIIFIFCIQIVISVPKVYLTNPRLLYENTRLGYGHIYFTISALIYIYFILCLFTEKRKYYLIIVLGLLYFTGSKAKMLTPLEIYILYYFYVTKGERYNIKKLFISMFFLCLSFYLVFSFSTNYLENKNFSNIISAMSGYSDYNRNFVMLIEIMSKYKNYFHGQITFENNIYSILPRILFQNKPEIFGDFRISYFMFPKETLNFTGAASFGKFGGLYADFGHFSLLIIIITSFISGIFIAISENTFLKNKNAITFMIYLFFMGFAIIDVGINAITIKIINFILIISIWMFMQKYKFRKQSE